MQLTLSDQIRVSDWIEAPKFRPTAMLKWACTMYGYKLGPVLATIPTHKLSQESFVNWQGMFEGGGLAD